MGLLISKLSQRFKKERRILMLGLDAVGKTTALYKFKSKVVNTVSTGFNVESVKHKRIEFTIWEIGGKDNLRRLWRYYCVGNDALIFIIDSTDPERLELAKEELWKILEEDEMKQCCVLIYANKRDISGVLPLSTIKDTLQLDRLTGKMEWMIQPCSAKTGDGLYEGLDWITRVLKKSDFLFF
eukprot:TRINITY_DN1552_c0_g1_i1.p1 TRINITY_DN1552_c0_g1~~TRINITY_DN1552_c0_g1_i1.p1  ORF type:complete len:183 (-),score=48.30 TRINITY_DN1552_c0_g1_i1:221-769(-)